MTAILVFVSYSQGIKAYKLYDIECLQFCIKRYGFHEDVFSFYNLSSSQISVDPFLGFLLPKSFHECSGHSSTLSMGLMPSASQGTNTLLSYGRNEVNVTNNTVEPSGSSQS